METTMQGMEEASRIISGKLGEINERNQNISGIVGTITKISEQTNLLSLNAAIQAEKAGEYGRGFNVVAREIGRLADQTAVSTLGIESKVKEMQTVVSSGVREMDRFIAEVRRTANDAVSISEQLTQIIQQVRVLLPQFEEIKAEVNGQTERTGELHRSMSSLSEDMQKAIDVVRGSFRVIERSRGNRA
jgi:methyl-accepting chemotaxis protein WspA